MRVRVCALLQACRRSMASCADGVALFCARYRMLFVCSLLGGLSSMLIPLAYPRACARAHKELRERARAHGAGLWCIRTTRISTSRACACSAHTRARARACTSARTHTRTRTAGSDAAAVIAFGGSFLFFLFVTVPKIGFATLLQARSMPNNRHGPSGKAARVIEVLTQHEWSTNGGILMEY